MTPPLVQPIPAATQPEDTTNAPAPLGKLLYRVPEATMILSISRSTIYELLRSGQLRSVKQGSTRLIPAGALAEYVRQLEAEALKEAC